MKLKHIGHDRPANTAQDGWLRVGYEHDGAHIVRCGCEQQIYHQFETGGTTTEHVARTLRHQNEADPVGPSFRCDLHHVGVRNSAYLHVCHGA